MPLNINNPYIPGDPYAYDLKWIVNKIRKLEGHLAAHLFEIIIDSSNSAITVRDCSSGEKLSTEADPAKVYEVCNRFFNTTWSAADLADLTPESYEYPNITEAPIVKIVNASGQGWISYARPSFDANGKLYLAWRNPNTQLVEKIIIDPTDDFTYANCTF